MTGALYLQWPGLDAAYQYPSEYTFGSDMVIAPVTAPGDPAPATVWIPPGSWVDYFTGERYDGPGGRMLSVPLSRMPVLVRAGAIVPTQPPVPYTQPAPSPTLILTAFPGADGRFTLYDDQGAGFGYAHGAYTRTPIFHTQRGGRATLTIGAARGGFPGAPGRRAWQVRFAGVAHPSSVRVDGGAERLTRSGATAGWSYDRDSRTLTVNIGAASTRRPVTITTE
jgi:hypothetical protein